MSCATIQSCAAGPGQPLASEGGRDGQNRLVRTSSRGGTEFSWYRINLSPLIDEGRDESEQAMSPAR